MKLFLSVILLLMIIPVSIYAAEDNECIPQIHTNDSEIIITCNESFRDLLNRIVILEENSQSTKNVQSEINYIKTLTIPDYSKLAEVIEFEGKHIQEQHGQTIRADFTIQGYYNDGEINVRCMLDGNYGNDAIHTKTRLGLNEYSIECNWANGTSGEVDIVFSGDIELITYTIPFDT